MSCKNLLVGLVLALLCVVQVTAQSQARVADFSFDVVGDGELKVGENATFKITMTPKPGWHIYSAVPSEEDVYGATEILYDITSMGFEVTGEIEEEGKLISEMDDIMGGMMRYYKTPAVFSQKMTLTEPEVKLVGTVDYMACDDMKCLFLSEEFELSTEASK